MKKTLVACMAIAALFALASGAGAITCTVDQRPAATLLVPYFEVAVNPDATPATGAAKFDTLVTIANASSAPMIAHVNVYNERSVLVLDFNVALTGFDVQAMSMAAVLSGNLPSTPIGTNHVGPDFTADPDDDACQRNPLAAVYPNAAGFLRIRPALADTATPDDNTLATSAYPVPAFTPGGPFAFQVLDSLDDTPDALECGDSSVDGVISGPIRGYITIDHANYCNLSNPRFDTYYSRDAMGNENNLWGEVIFISGAGVGTFGGSTVNIESDRAFSTIALGGQVNQSDTVRTRTFYARYWTPSLELTCFGGNCAQFALTNPWNQGFGDEREPIGLRYAARYFEGNGVTSKFRVWRGSSGSLSDLTGSPIGDCDDVLPTVQLNFFDEDENGVSQIGPGPCPSPCTTPPPPSFNFPVESQVRNVGGVGGFTLPAAFGGAQVGWVSMEFYNPTGPNAGSLDQAWVEYQFQGPAAFLSASAPATQLDPSTCNPLAGNVSPTNPSNTNIPGINVIIPTIPGGLTGEGCSLTLACTGTGP